MAAGVDPLARGEALDVARVRADRRGVGRRADDPDCSVTVARAREDQPAPRRRRAARRRLPPARHRLPGGRPVRRRHRPRRPTAGRSTCAATGDVDAGGVPADGHNIVVRAAAAARRPPRRRRARRASHIAQGHPGRRRDGRRSARTPRRAGRARPALGRCDTSDDDLLRLAAELGSDVPFALVGRHRARHRPRRGGRRRVDDDGHLVVGAWCPRGEGLSTPAVYRRLRRARTPTRRRARASRDRADRALRDGDAVALGAGAAQRPAGRPPSTCARTSATCSPRASDAGALRGLVSGSGPTCVFLVGSTDDAPARSRPALAERRTPSCWSPPARSPAPTWSRGLTSVANLVNLERVSKAYGVRPLLTDVSPRRRRRASGSASSAATATARPRCSR